MADRKKNETGISVESIFGHASQRGIVKLTVAQETVSLSPADARYIGMWLLEAAEAAQSDEALMLLVKDLGLDQQTGTMMLMKLRDQREEVRLKRQALSA